MAQTYPISEIPSLAGKTIFFDANVLIYNFWPTGQYQWEQSYSRAFGRLLRQENPLAINFLVLSEVVNRVLRIGHHNHLQAHPRANKQFKAFRNSAAGRRYLKDIYSIIRTDILPRFQLLDQLLTTAELTSFAQVDSLDFNDKYLVKLCQDRKMVLLTNDGDFAQSEVDLLTSNPVLLKSRF